MARVGNVLKVALIHVAGLCAYGMAVEGPAQESDMRGGGVTVVQDRGCQWGGLSACLGVGVVSFALV